MSDMRYPLAWPVGWPRTKLPEWSRFDHKLTLGRSRDELVEEIGRMGGKKIILSTNIPVKKDGMPYANYKALSDTGVAVYFTLKGHPKVFACDHWRKIEDNMRAITKTIYAFRGVERWGVSDIMDRIYRGFQALPESTQAVEVVWWDVLGVSRDAGAAEIKKRLPRKSEEGASGRGRQRGLFSYGQAGL